MAARPATRYYNIEDNEIINALKKQAIDKGFNSLKPYVEHILTKQAKTTLKK